MKNQYTYADILGVKVDAQEKEDVYRSISEILRARRGAKIFTPNGEIIYKAQRDNSLREILNSADVSLPDGISTVIGAWLSGTPIGSRISGIDAADHILASAAKEGLSVYLLGGSKGVAEGAAKRLRKKFTGLRICGAHHGYFTPGGEEEKALLRDIRRTAPDILFVCLGSPAQEKWISRHTPTLPSLRLSMGLGGSLDVWSENKKRAPRLLRALGLEWLYRILCDPRRIKRLPLLAGYFSTLICRNVKDRANKLSTLKKRM